MQNLKIKFRLRTNQLQKAQLESIAGSCRFVWNLFLDGEIANYMDLQKFKGLGVNSAELTQIKKFDGYEWLADSPSTAIQQTLDRLDKTLKRFLDDKKLGNRNTGFPRFKSKKEPCKSFNLTMVEFSRSIRIIDGNYFFKNKDLLIRIENHREIPTDFKSCQIIKELDHWYISFITKVPKAPKKAGSKITGIDLNSKEFATTDDTFVIPKPFLENQEKLKELQRALSRREKGSKNYYKCLRQLRKLNKHCSNIMHDYFHKLSRHLVDSYDTLVIEDLDVKAIQQKFGKVIANNGFGYFRAMLEYKSEIAGTNVIVADRYFPSSQICSGCGNRQKLKLSMRTYSCSCGLTIDRDTNAAINLRNYGLLHPVRID